MSRIACPHCRQPYAWSHATAGQTLACGRCRQTFVSPFLDPGSVGKSPFGGRSLKDRADTAYDLGVWSFYTSLFAFLCVGALSPIAVILSVLSLLMAPRKAHKSHAIGGLILGMVGCWWIYVGLAIVFLAWYGSS